MAKKQKIISIELHFVLKEADGSEIRGDFVASNGFGFMKQALAWWTKYKQRAQAAYTKFSPPT